LLENNREEEGEREEFKFEEKKIKDKEILYKRSKKNKSLREIINILIIDQKEILPILANIQHSN
jgi:hypothetical protein